MSRQKGLYQKKKFNLTLRPENVEVINYVLKPMGISLSGFINMYIDSMADAIRDMGITPATLKNFTIGELQETFSRLQVALDSRKADLSELQQTLLPGLKKGDD